jgi:hypothetical protein
MKQKLVVAAVIAFVLLMAALEHLAGRQTVFDAPGIVHRATDSAAPGARDNDGVSASPLLTR